MIFLRQKYKEKPKQYGPASEVQSSVFKNAESRGYDPALLEAIFPAWENAGGTLYDYSGNKHNGSVGGSAALQKSSMYFPGTANSCITIPNSGLGDTNELQFSYESVTIIFHVYFLSGFSSAYVIGCYRDSTSNRFINIDTDAVSGGMDINFVLRDVNGITVVVNSGSLALNKWHKIACVYNYDDKAYVYVDGKLKDSATDTTLYASVADRNWVFGAKAEDTTSELFKGYLDNIHFHRSAFTPAQVAHLSDNPYFLLNRVAPVFYSIPQTASVFKPFWASQATRISL